MGQNFSRLRFKFERKRFGRLPMLLSIQQMAVCGLDGANSHANVKSLHHAIFHNSPEVFLNRIVPATDYNVQPTSRLFSTLYIKHDEMITRS
jgi:hypothetical protein